MSPHLYQYKYYLLKPGTRKFYKTLNKNQHLSQDHIESISFKKAQNLIRYAYENVPYYHKKYSDCGMHPEDIRTPDDFLNVPLLKKEEIRQHADDMISKNFSLKDLNPATTGGSTGQLLRLYHQKNVPRAAMGWRMMNWWGISPGSDSAWIWRMGKPSIKNKLISTVIDWPSRTIQLDAAKMTTSNIREFISAYNNSQIKLVHGYVGAVHELATFIVENNISVRPPKAVSVTSSAITLGQEKLIERAFQAPVYDLYGCSEVFWLAAQCDKRKHLHRFHDIRRIEFIDENGETCTVGQLGRIVITNLEAYAFPIIRYLVGDMGREVTGKCSCGVNLPLMEKVSGRITDTIKMPDGTVVSGDYLTTIFHDFAEEITQFQVHQQKTGDMLIRVVPSQNAGSRLPKIYESVTRKCHHDFCNGQVNIEFETTAKIPHVRGKHMQVICDYSPN